MSEVGKAISWCAGDSCRLFSADLRRFSTPTGKCSWVRAKCKTGCEVDRTKRRARIGNHWWRIVGRLGWLGYVGTNGNVIYIDLWYCHTLWQCGLFDLSGCYGEVICHVSKLCSGMGHLPNEESWCCDMWLLGRAGAAINCHCMTCHNMLQPVTKDNCAQGRFHFMDRLPVKS